MRKYIFFGLIVLAGCIPQANEKTVQNLVATVDSLKTVNSHKQVFIDSLRIELSYQEMMARRTAIKVHDYAVIVKNNPSQSVFIVNWVDSAFEYTKPQKAKL